MSLASTASFFDNRRSPNLLYSNLTSPKNQVRSIVGAAAAVLSRGKSCPSDSSYGAWFIELHKALEILRTIYTSSPSTTISSHLLRRDGCSSLSSSLYAPTFTLTYSRLVNISCQQGQENHLALCLHPDKFRSPSGQSSFDDDVLNTR
jgi:hypothetical protein